MFSETFKWSSSGRNSMAVVDEFSVIRIESFGNILLHEVFESARNAEFLLYT